MKKIFLCIAFILFFFLLLSCDNSVNLSFTKDSYVIHSGEAVTVSKPKKGITYEILSDYDRTQIILDENTGVFSFDNTLSNGTQVLYVAKYQNDYSKTVVVTLEVAYQNSEIEFLNFSNYLVNGDKVIAKSSNDYAITYSLKEKVNGISINESSGKVSYTSTVQNNTSFTVVASSHNSISIEKTFIAMTEGFVKALNQYQAVEKNQNHSVSFYLDFSDDKDVEARGVLGIANNYHEELSKNMYSYNPETKRVIIENTYLEGLTPGEHLLNIYTGKNSVSVTIEVANKFIYTVEDLLSIKTDTLSLAGTYLLMCDLDLTNYLSDKPLGWDPIGEYKDVLDQTKALQYAFKGTFNGNGHTISGLQMNRKDEKSFNAGLFGCVGKEGIVKNVKIVGTMDVSSYSGGIVGLNYGTIENCYSEVSIKAFSQDVTYNYRYLGGLVGNNLGTVTSSISNSFVECNVSYGAFVGNNEGIISNCFAIQNNQDIPFCGSNSTGKDCYLFSSLEELNQYDFSTKLSDCFWNFENAVFLKKDAIPFYEIDSIQIDQNSLQDQYFPGDVIDVGVFIYPNSFQTEENMQYISFETKETQVEINGNQIVVPENVSSLTITAIYDNDSVHLEDTVTILVNKKVTSLTLNVETTMVAGKSYSMSVDILPLDATEDVVYHLTKDKVPGVTIDDNMILIDYYTTTDYFSVIATSKYSQISSKPVMIEILRYEILNNMVIRQDETEPMIFTFETEDLSGVKVMMNESSIPFAVNGQTIIVQRDVLSQGIEKEYMFTFEMKNGNRYLCNAFYHAMYSTEELISLYPKAILIRSKEDFYTYFNTNASNYREEKNQYLKEIFILTVDLDFEYEEFISIGYDAEALTTKAVFTGKFFGQGHTISNVKVIKNGVSFISQTVSSSYGIGLFAASSGCFYDLNVRNINATGSNFVGGLIGMMTGGILTNCHVVNDTSHKIIASGYTETNDEGIHVAGVVGKKWSGETNFITYNNSKTNLIG